jgi:UDP-N-acetylmuramate dehydrogenase
VNKVRENIKRINKKGMVAFSEPLSSYTTFRIGGPADVFVCPGDQQELKETLQFLSDEQIPVFILGGGANILVSDKGFRGAVVSLTKLDKITQQGSNLIIEAGAKVSDVSAYAAQKELAGFDFIYAMPGSFGGAVWMNARCYGGEIGDVLTRINYLDDQLQLQTMIPKREEFQYKNTPFMNQSWIILEGEISLTPCDDLEELWKQMHSHEDDRRQKGHFTAPCAGSIFKNNRDFGAPSGKLIDTIGLKGYRHGGAQIHPNHGNIIINTGQATAKEISELIDLIQERVYKELGFNLEPEVLKVGDWE